VSFSFFYYLYGFFSCYSRLSGDSFKNLYDSRNQSGLLGSISHPFYIFVLLSLCVLLTSCASSDVSRDAASNVDMGVQNAKNLVSGVGNSDVADTYQNTSQVTKGAILGGAAGAVTGAVYSGIGVLPGTAAGIILGASYGSYIDSLTNLEDKLENRGVTIVVIGDQILIVLRSARLFNSMSSTLKPQSYSTLSLVTQYINGFTKMLVKVAAYTDDTGAPDVDMALSKQQADNVAKALLAYGVDARVLYAEGMGGTHLRAKNTMQWDGNDNYRVEITLEKLYV